MARAVSADGIECQRALRQNHAAHGSHGLDELSPLFGSAINVSASKPLCSSLQAEEQKMLPLFLFPICFLQEEFRAQIAEWNSSWMWVKMLQQNGARKFALYLFSPLLNPDF